MSSGSFFTSEMKYILYPQSIHNVETLRHLLNSILYHTSVVIRNMLRKVKFLYFYRDFAGRKVAIAAFNTVHSEN
jgi:hypothetical protein